MKRRFQNLDNIDKNKINLRKLYRYFRIRNKGKDLTKRIPVNENPEITYLQHNRSDLTYTWIGHSTFFIQCQGLNILTDPVFSKRMGTEKRLVPLGIDVASLPDIDIVIISHAHFDHLDFSSIIKLKGNPRYYVPQGLSNLFKKRKITSVSEANWWDGFKHKGIDLHFVPAQHWSRRNLFDRNQAHWGGWIIHSAEHTFYFAGDTGYFRGFCEIGKHFAIDTAFMPIGDYEPVWMSGLQHMNPEESVQAFLDLDAQTFVPMHYGTYRLSMDTGPEALERLEAEWLRKNTRNKNLNILKIGETIF
ncbi:MBL fold metallo-hydrolase [Halalkalibacter okhensis]|uniref:Beta-lactamase n=1 Tax=Halalkalibacter okhensis TaxID=333138 RepID=A0A0B0IK32_9BACI|nr:MBL fold metallo-hydrolase [Halalkalibacter okhensis]KHF40036.1 beta-lactamase [Halalkalibacter okhensis]